MTGARLFRLPTAEARLPPLPSRGGDQAACAVAERPPFAQKGSRKADFDVDVAHAHLGETSVRRFRRGIGFRASGREFTALGRGEIEFVAAKRAVVGEGARDEAAGMAPRVVLEEALVQPRRAVRRVEARIRRPDGDEDGLSEAPEGKMAKTPSGLAIRVAPPRFEDRPRRGKDFQP